MGKRLTTLHTLSNVCCAEVVQHVRSALHTHTHYGVWGVLCGAERGAHLPGQIPPQAN
jgi:hypothetical protein